MNELALFAGAGGGILGGKLLGWRTVCAVELDAFAATVLAQRQNDGVLPAFPIWADVTTFDGRPWRGIVDVVSGGFPCQDISAAGRGAGIEGKRSGLWVEMARIIDEVRPRFAFVENSPVLTARGLGRVLGDLAEMGFDARWGVLGAADAGAPHLRERIWIMAYAHGEGELQPEGREPDERGRVGDCGGEVAYTDAPGLALGELHAGISGEAQRGDPRQASLLGGEMADPARILEGRSEQRAERERVGAGGESLFPDTCEHERDGRAEGPGRREPCASTASGGTRREGAEGADWWLFEPDVGRVADGVADRVDRLKALGNGQVPAVAALAWRTLMTQATAWETAQKTRVQPGFRGEKYSQGDV